jgi:hypothetical protein
VHTSEVSGDQHEVGVDHGECGSHIPPEVVGALRVVHAEVEIRELGHPHHPIRSAGHLHHLPLVTGRRERSGRRGDEGQEDGEEPGAARPHGEGADRDHDGELHDSVVPSPAKCFSALRFQQTNYASGRRIRVLLFRQRRRDLRLFQTFNVIHLQT